MSNDITVKKKELITAIEDKTIEEIIKPLVSEIHLFDTFIAGTTHLEDTLPLEKLMIGDKVSLRREANKFDEKAIMIVDADGSKLGYIPEKDNEDFGSFKKIAIGIYLVDY